MSTNNQRENVPAMYLCRIEEQPFDSIRILLDSGQWEKFKIVRDVPKPPRPAPAGCVTCAKVTSLIPELSVETGRVN